MGAPPVSGPKRMPARIGRFEIREELGSGGFGTVYRAYDPRLDRDVALKVPHSDLRDPSSLNRFLSEAKAAAQFRHPHVVPLYEIEVESDEPFIVSAFIKGETLEEVVARGPLEPRRAATIIRDLAEAAHAAHALNIIHRDIKPANVMLEGEDHALLMDFGLARSILSRESLTRTGNVLGTPAYIAPERTSDDHPADSACDQYSLGVTFYELLCGKPPYSGPAQVILYNAVHHEPVAPSQVNPLVPRALARICLKAMAKSPADRYPSCRALAAELRRWLAAEAESTNDFSIVVDASLSSKPPSPRRPRHRSTFVGLFLTAVIGTVSALVGSRWLRQPNAEIALGTASVAKALVPSETVHQAVRTESPAPKAAPAPDPARPAITVQEPPPDVRSPAAIQEGPLTKPSAFVASSKAPTAPADALPPPAEVATEMRDYAGLITRAYDLCRTADFIEARKVLDQCAVANRGWEWEFCNRLCNYKPRPAPKRKSGQRTAAQNRAVESLVLEREGWLLHGAAYRPHPVTPIVIATYGTEQVPTVARWNLASLLWDEPFVFGTPRRPSGVYLAPQFSANSRWLALTKANFAVELRDAQSWDVRATYVGQGEPIGVTRIAFSGNSEYLALGCGTAPIHIYDISSSTRISILQQGLTHSLSCLALDQVGQLVAAGTDEGGILIWETATQRMLVSDHTASSPILALTFSPSGQSIFVIRADGTMELRQVRNGKIDRWFRITGHKGPIFAAALSPDSRRVVTGGEDMTVRVRESMSGQTLVTLEGHRDTVKSLAFSADGQSIISVSHDNTVRVWWYTQR